MLDSLKISNYALIKELDIDFTNGFSTLTGETGAGKSILLGALGLALGNRADSTILSDNEKKCVIEACFNISDFNLKKTFDDLDLDYEEHTLIRREIGINGKSRSFINDTPVNLNDLKTISGKLIDVHSQHENLSLNNNLFQLNVLDSVAKNQVLLNKYKIEFTKYNSIKNKLTALQDKAKAATSDSEYFQFQFDQLNKLKLEDTNQGELESELERLNNAEEIQIQLSQAFQLLSTSETNILDQLKQCKAAFGKIESFLPKAENFNQRIESCLIDLQDIAAETEIEAESMEYNPARISIIKETLDNLYTQFQKHNSSTVDELISLRNNLDEKLRAEANYSDEIEALSTQLSEQTIKLNSLSADLNKSRSKSIPSLSSTILKILNELGMPNAKFNVVIENTESFTATGKNSIQFQFSANNNHAAQNISKIASGGEISRLMLSIKYVLSQSISLPTIIFDEIDTGVSGEIADKMANIMQSMAENMQVISITHLPQIAAKGKTHYKVFKIDVNNHVETRIGKLNTEERIDEIAKMLSGQNITQQAIENAKTLIAF